MAEKQKNEAEILDFSKMISQFLQHPESIENLHQGDLKALKDLVEYYKGMIQRRIVAERLTHGDLVLDQVIDAQEKIFKRVEVFEGVIDSLENRKGRYRSVDDAVRSDKIRLYEKAIERLRGIAAKIDSVDDFVFEVVGEANKFQYQNLMDMCATSMAMGYMGMESFGGALFEHVGKGNFEGYVPNPEAISRFLEFVRNPKLVHEVDGFVSLMRQQADRNTQIRAIKMNNEGLEEFKNNPEACQRVVDYLKKLDELTTTRRSLQNFINAYKDPSVWEKVAGVFSKDKKPTLQDLKTQLLQVESEIKTLNGQLSAEERTVLGVFDRFHALALSGQPAVYGHHDETLASVSKNPDFYEIILGAVDKNLEAESKDIARIRGEHTQLEEAKKASYEAMSPEAKAVIDDDIYPYKYEQRYIEGKDTRYDRSPLVCSLILEALMKKTNVKTIEELAELGIVVTKESIAKTGKYEEEIIRRLRDALSKLSKTDENLEYGF